MAQIRKISEDHIEEFFMLIKTMVTKQGLKCLDSTSAQSNRSVCDPLQEWLTNNLTNPGSLLSNYRSLSQWLI